MTEVPFICYGNQWTGFCMKGISVMKELIFQGLQNNDKESRRNQNPANHQKWSVLRKIVNR